MILLPGMNIISMNGVMDPSIAHLDLVSEFFSRYMRGEESQVSVTGVNAGPDAPLWLDRAVQKINTTSDFKGYASPLTLLGGLELGAMGITIDAEGNPLFSGEVNATMKLPASMQMPMAIPCSAMSFNMSDDQGNVLGTPFP